MSQRVTRQSANQQPLAFTEDEPEFSFSEDEADYEKYNPIPRASRTSSSSTNRNTSYVTQNWVQRNKHTTVKYWKRANVEGISQPFLSSRWVTMSNVEQEAEYKQRLESLAKDEAQVRGALPKPDQQPEHEEEGVKIEQGTTTTVTAAITTSIPSDDATAIIHASSDMTDDHDILLNMKTEDHDELMIDKNNDDDLLENLLNI